MIPPDRLTVDGCADGLVRREVGHADIDDVDGYGPESINLSIPEGTESEPVTYSVGVYYYSAHDHGPSDPTVRIIIDGVERYRATLGDLEDREFWDVARITWPTRYIETIDQVFPAGFP